MLSRSKEVGCPYCSHFFDFISDIEQPVRKKNKDKVNKKLAEIKEEYSYEVCHHTKSCFNLDLKLLYLSYNYKTYKTYAPSMGNLIKGIQGFASRATSSSSRINKR